MTIIKGTTKLLGVIGNPVEHSLSPVMHNAAIAHLNVDYVYLPLPVKPEDLAKAIAGFEAIQLAGFNITIPHKQAIMPLLQEISPEAKLVGAVNTVWYTPKGWQGTNTDVAGFIAPLKNINRDWSQTTAVVLGNGGAARAVVVGCHQLGCADIKVVGRNPDKLAKFNQSWQESDLAEKINVHRWSELPKILPETGLLVNTTPVGMHPQTEASPLDESLIGKLPSQAIAYDLIYTPNPTQFLKLAKNHGAIALDGLEMLVQQGAAALKIWLGQAVPVEIMRESLVNCLGLK